MWGRSNRWSRKALLVLEAYQIYIDSLCGSCGQSAFHALDQMNTREFNIDAVLCLGCEVRERDADQSEDEKHQFGEKRFVVNTMGHKVV
jgi:uncharacterized cysteine cluster protein YcgN (CxxCxxCC family)